MRKLILRLLAKNKTPREQFAMATKLGIISPLQCKEAETMIKIMLSEGDPYTYIDRANAYKKEMIGI